MSCHVCRETGEHECDPVLADMKCEMCGYCAAKAKLEEEEKRSETL